MRITTEDRPKVKAECLRLLATLRLDPARTKLISGFVDAYLRLNQQEEQVFQEEVGRLEATEREDIMEIVTSWMEQGLEQGLERGLEQGIEQGRQETQTEIARNMLQKNMPLETIAEVTGLTIAQLQQLQASQQQE